MKWLALFVSVTASTFVSQSGEIKQVIIPQVAIIQNLPQTQADADKHVK